MLTIEWYNTQSNVMINMFAHPKTTTTPENNIPLYASRSKCSSILLLSVNRRRVGTWRIFLQPVSEKWLSILFKYRSDGRSPFLPKSCLFWLAAMAKATTAKKNKKKKQDKTEKYVKSYKLNYVCVPSRTLFSKRDLCYIGAPHVAFWQGYMLQQHPVDPSALTL